MFYHCVASTSSVVDVRASRMRCPSKKKFASNNAIVDSFIGVAVATYMYLLPWLCSTPRTLSKLPMAACIRYGVTFEPSWRYPAVSLARLSIGRRA